jgi:hypothetical protein
MATKTAKRINKKPAVRYIVNLQGQKTEAVLPISIYRRLLEQAEELEDIRHFDKAMKKQLGLQDRDPKASDERPRPYRAQGQAENCGCHR